MEDAKKLLNKKQTLHYLKYCKRTHVLIATDQEIQSDPTNETRTDKEM